MNISNVDATTVRRWLNNDEAILIDVREPDEHAAIHIVEAKNIPLGTLKSHFPLDCGGKKLVFHCRSGARSQQACEAFAKQCPEAQVFNLEGGIISWEAKGHDVRQQTSTDLPSNKSE